MGAATLGSVFENYRLNATCHDCGQSKELDVGQLMEKKDEPHCALHLARIGSSEYPQGPCLEVLESLACKLTPGAG